MTEGRAAGPGREAALAWASLAQRCPASSVSPGKEQAAGVWESILKGLIHLLLLDTGLKQVDLRLPITR